MKKIIIISGIVASLLSASVAAANLSVDRQIEIITSYMSITGQRDRIPSSFTTGEMETPDTERPIKCGTSAALDFALNRDRLDRDLVTAMGATFARPTRDLDYDSPEGFFKLHYTKTGANAVRDPGKDSDGDGVPDYVESVAMIFDSVYHHVHDTLGFGIPPTDDSLGGDNKYDVYLTDIDTDAFGFTQTDDPNSGSSQSVFSYIEIDNDFIRFEPYKNRPLDAVRVTAAHEYFHAIHFDLDVFETETYGSPTDGHQPRYWMEMSATWMEEEIYDEVNDYYFYLPTFFADPRLSIQQFLNPIDLHPYGAVVYPIFLSEKYDRDIIKTIWLECAAVPGANFLKAVDSALGTAVDTLDFDGTTATTDTVRAFEQVFAEFTVWNFFTGNRADMAPAGIGYSERDKYPGFPDYTFDIREEFPVIIFPSKNPYSPDHLAASYLKVDQLQAFKEEYYWNYLQPGDSLQVTDTVFLRCARDSCIDRDTTAIGCPPGTPIDQCCLEWQCVEWSTVFDTALGYDTSAVRWTWFIDSVEITDLSGTRFQYTGAGCDPPGSLCDTVISNFDVMSLDSNLLYFPSFDRTFKNKWGVSILFQLESERDSFVVFSDVIDMSYRYLFADPFNYVLRRDSTSPPPDSSTVFSFSNPRQYRSITFALSPASTNKANYGFTLFRGKPVTYGGYIQGRLVDSLRESAVDPNALNVMSEVLFPYPNPFVVSEMPGKNMKLQFQVPTNRISIYKVSNPRLTMDFYTVAGERVRSVDTVIAIDPINFYLANERVVLFEAEWDLKNQFGRNVASGVYLIHVQLFASTGKADLLTDKTTKVVVIR